MEGRAQDADVSGGVAAAEDADNLMKNPPLSTSMHTVLASIDSMSCLVQERERERDGQTDADKHALLACPNAHESTTLILHRRTGKTQQRQGGVRRVCLVAALALAARVVVMADRTDGGRTAGNTTSPALSLPLDTLGTAAAVPMTFKE